MTCEPLKLPDGFAIVCVRGRTLTPCALTGCGRARTKSCGWPLGDGRTCDKNLCDRHAYVSAEGVFCPGHFEMMRQARKPEPRT